MKPLPLLRTTLPAMALAALTTSAIAQKYGGTLRFPLRENPPCDFARARSRRIRRRATGWRPGRRRDDDAPVWHLGADPRTTRNGARLRQKYEAKIDEQSATIDPVKRKLLVHALDLMLQQETARVAVYHSTSAACWQPYVKGYLRSANGI